MQESEGPSPSQQLWPKRVLLKNGKCNEANNAPLGAVTEVLTGSGKASF
jgi:hypothetical protein